MGARGISGGVKGTGEASGEDKERSGTGAAFDPAAPCATRDRPSTHREERNARYDVGDMELHAGDRVQFVGESPETDDEVLPETGLRGTVVDTEFDGNCLVEWDGIEVTTAVDFADLKPFWEKDWLGDTVKAHEEQTNASRLDPGWPYED